MSSFSPQNIWAKLESDLVNDLITMWSAKHETSERTQTNLRRQLSELDYDPETIRRWKAELAVWRKKVA